MIKHDAGKHRLGLFATYHPDTLLEECRVLEYGAEKYSPDGWRTVPDARARYVSALYRHLHAYMHGEILDSESGMHHMSHIRCNAAFIFYFDRLREAHALRSVDKRDMFECATKDSNL